MPAGENEWEGIRAKDIPKTVKRLKKEMLAGQGAGIRKGGRAARQDQEARETHKNWRFKARTPTSHSYPEKTPRPFGRGEEVRKSRPSKMTPLG